MNKLICLFFILLTLAGVAKEQEATIQHDIVQHQLNPAIARTIYLAAANTGPTTMMFPSRIDSVAGDRVASTFDSAAPMPFVLDWDAKNSYFTIWSLAEMGTRGSINVVYNGHIYIFNLDTVPTEMGNRSVTMTHTGQGTGSRYSKAKPSRVSPNILLSLLDKAKAYHLFAAKYPAQVAELDYHLANRELEYDAFKMLLKEVIRYDKYDTIVFHAQLQNMSDVELRYSPKDISVSLGSNTYGSSITDASGVIPPMGVTTIYFGITGTPFGGRNNLGADNDWSVLIPMSQMPNGVSDVKRSSMIESSAHPAVTQSEDNGEIEESVSSSTDNDADTAESSETPAVTQSEDNGQIEESLSSSTDNDAETAESSAPPAVTQSEDNGQIEESVASPTDDDAETAESVDPPAQEGEVSPKQRERIRGL